ncbi:MAG: metalloregulator ArsR/SmtB family transcription factor [Candidatus Paceibacterota bacterium]|jgi:ArsR family transcriptional regulator
MNDLCFPSFFKAIGHPVRQRILEELRKSGELNVSDLVKRLGLAQATVSHHLALLKKSGAVKMRTEGTNSFYGICCEKSADCCCFLEKFFRK